MKKILLFLMTFWCAIVSMAQSFDVEKNAALQIVSANRTAIGLTADDLNNLMVTYSYVDKTIGVRYIYVQQTYKGIPVYNKTQSIAYKNNALASVMGNRIADVESKVNNISGMPAKTAESAVMAALANKGFSPSGSLAPISTKEMGRKVEFGKLGVSRENVTAQLMWFPTDNENSLKLGWFVYYIPTTTSDYWEIFVDANNGSIIGENNLTVSCNWDNPNHTHVFGEKHNQATMGNNLFDFSRVNRIENGTVSPSLVSSASYRVVPVPYEAPTFMPGAFPGTAPGNSTIVNNPWTNVPASFSNAITKNWHTDVSNTDYNYTRGNNVWAYHDRNNNNSGDPARSATSTTALPNLTFSAFGNAPDYTADPVTGGGTTGTMANNQSFNITNLFYYNNILHDVLYTHGFDEVARNFQSDNFGRGGNGNDYVLGEAQDGSGTNNANFSTPADGSNGRMQMYIWTTTTPNRDGDVDNGIIAHEFGHGVSNRLMGSSTNQTGCVGSGEHQGEGISDYIGLMLTQDWAASNVNSGLVGRGIGTFALNEPPTGAGIRSQRYSTDLAINNKMYLASLPTQVHSRGEHWCAAAWEATWAIIQQAGTISPTIYYNSAAGGNGQAGNIAAMRIAMQAMKLVPCGAGFIDHRDGWLKADTLLYGGQFSCAIWRAFAKRGMGFFANQGSAGSAGDQTPDNTPKSQASMTTGVTSIPAGQNMTYTVTASTCSGTAITGYTMRTTLPANVTFVSATNGGTHAGGIVTWPVSMAANGTFTAQVTITVNANAFPGNVVTNTCLLDNNATPRTFNCTTITTPITPVLAGCPTVSTQPVSVTTCVGSSVNFGVVANASSAISYQWQVLVGSTWTNLTNTAPYSNVTTATMTINPTAVGLNGNQYRCFMTTSDCTSGINSNPATLTVVAASIGGTLSPAATLVCGVTNSTAMTLSGHVGNVVTWEVSTNGGTTWTPIAGTAGATTYTAVNVTVTSQYRAVVQVSGGCAAVNSAIAVITFQASLPLSIQADPSTPICAGDNTRLTAGEGGFSTFSNTAAITIPSSPGNFNPYPANVVVSGLPTSGVTVSSVALKNMNHTWAGDLDILLQSPSGQNVILLSDLGADGNFDFSNTTITFKDGSPRVPSVNPVPTGTYSCTNDVSNADYWPPPGPLAVTQGATPLLSTFSGDMNGTWKLYGYDAVSGDGGVINGGIEIVFSQPFAPTSGGTFVWSPATGLNSTTTNPVAASPAVTTTYTVTHNNGASCIRSASYTVVVRQRPLVATQPSNTTVCENSTATFTITATGEGPLTYQWQVSTDGGTTWTNLANAAPYSGVNTATLTINPSALALNNNRYRCQVGGACSPIAGSTSQAAVLTVNPLPTVTIAPAGSVCGGVATINGTALTATGNANTYTWSPVTGLYTDATAITPYVAGTNAATVYAAPTTLTTYTVTATNTTTTCIKTASVIVNYTPPAPQVTPNPVSMCLGTPAVMLKSSSSTTRVSNFTSGTINVAIPEGNFPARPATAASSVIAVSGIPANATITGVAAKINATHPYANDIVAVLKAPSGAVINLDAIGGYANNAGANYLDTKFSSAGTASISTGTAPFTGTWKADLAGVTFNVVFGGNTFTLSGGPVGFDPTTQLWNTYMSTLAGGAANGNWTLAAYDAGAPDIGNLTKWDLEITYVEGVPSTPAVWSPATGLYSDATAQTAYVAGTPVDSVWVKPSTPGVHNYDVTVQSLPPAPVGVTSNLVANNGFSLVTFNFVNNNSYPVAIRSISSATTTANAATRVEVFTKAGAITGAPGAINAANGWTSRGTATIAALGGGAIQPFLTNITSIPNVDPGQTLSIAVQAVDNLAYSGTGTSLPPTIFTANGCSIVTGPSIGFGGDVAPNAPTFTPRGFIGSVDFVNAGVTPCTSPARRVVVTVRDTVKIVTNPVNTSACITTGTNTRATFSVVATGDALTYQWQTSTGGTAWVNVTNDANYSGATTSTLTISNPPVSWNGRLYQVIVTGSCGSKAAPSGPLSSVLLTVPSVTLDVAPNNPRKLKLFPGETTTLVAIANPTPLPSPLNYEWYKNGSLVATTVHPANQLVVDVDGLGDYTVKTVNSAGCANVSNMITISDSASGKVFIYPNPNNGIFQVRYHAAFNSRAPRGLNIYDDKGSRISISQYPNTAPYQRMNVDLRNHGKGIYWVEVVDVNGERLAMGRVVVL